MSAVVSEVLCIAHAHTLRSWSAPLPQICLAAALALGAVEDIAAAMLALVLRCRTAQQLSCALQTGVLVLSPNCYMLDSASRCQSCVKFVGALS